MGDPILLRAHSRRIRPALITVATHQRTPADIQGGEHARART
jgi:hypothetical protein